MNLRGVLYSSYTGLFRSWELAVAKRIIHEFIGRWNCFSNNEFDDLLQECLVHWYFVRDKYDPKYGASRQTFMGRITRRKLTDIVRERQANKRKISYLAESLDEPIGYDEEPRTLMDKVEECLSDPASVTGIHETDLKIDTSKVLEKLTPKQRHLCRLFEDGLNITDISRVLNIPRGAIYDEINRIKALFIDEGLSEYLE